MALVLTLAVHLAETAESAEEGGVNPYVVGAVTLGLLLIALLAVVSIGGGRDHT